MASKNNFYFFYALSLAWQLGFLVAVPVIGLLVGGIYLDKKWGTSPLCLIASIGILFVLLEIEMRYLLKPFLKKHSQSKINSKSKRENKN